MTHSRSLPVTEYEEQEKKELTYDEWVQELRKDFKGRIKSDTEYTAEEKNRMVEKFIANYVRFELRKYIGNGANYSYFKRVIKNSLFGCFDTVKKTQQRIEESFNKALEKALRDEHAEKYSDFIATGTNID